MTKSTYALSPSRKWTYWSVGRLNWTWGYDIFFVENPESRRWNQVNLVCPIHCPICNALAHEYVQEVFCPFLCAHISTQIIFVCSCSHFCANIFEGTTYLRAIVRAYKSCAYADCRQIVNRTSVTSDSFSRLSYISLSLPEVVRTISYKVMLIKKSLLDQFCEPASSQRTISWIAMKDVVIM